MDGRDYANFFTQSEDATHRRYEALRAIFVEGEPTVDVADRMKISQGTLRNWACEFRKQYDAGCVSPFFLSHGRGVLQDDPTSPVPTTPRSQMRKPFN